MRTAVVGDGTRLGAVHLDVTDLDRSVATWRDVIGLQIINAGEGTAELGVAAEALIVLHGRATSPIRGPVAGLFHVAMEVPTRNDLARVAARVLQSGLKHTGLDHLTTDSVYVTDLDGIDIEVSLATPGRGRIEIIDGNPRAVPNDGSTHSGREPLDLVHLAKAAGGDDRPPLAVGTRVSHLHLRSRAPRRLLEFYCDVVGFLPFVNSPTLGMHDAGTAASSHILAFNNWGGPAIEDRSQGTAGLACFEIVVRPGELASLQQRLGAGRASSQAGGSNPAYRDPDGNAFCLAPSHC
jgi:catechol 2,3-dioxygenase